MTYLLALASLLAGLWAVVLAPILVALGYTPAIGFAGVAVATLAVWVLSR